MVVQHIGVERRSWADVELAAAIDQTTKDGALFTGRIPEDINCSPSPLR
jgi:hypothetical protein